MDGWIFLFTVRSWFEVASGQFQCKPLQKDGWLLTVDDVTLSNTRHNVSEQRASFEVLSCNVMDQTEAVENSIPWTEEETCWPISVWSDSSIKAKLQDISQLLLLSVWDPLYKKQNKTFTSVNLMLLPCSFSLKLVVQPKLILTTLSLG